jgi:hypothetical protein
MSHMVVPGHPQWKPVLADIFLPRAAKVSVPEALVSNDKSTSSTD